MEKAGLADTQAAGAARGRGRPWWLFPLHAAAVLTSAKSFRDNAVIGSPALNRRGLHVARRLVAEKAGARRRRLLARDLDAADRAALDRDGFVVKPDFLPAAAFGALRDEVLALRAPAREAVIGDVLTRLIPVDSAVLRAAPTLARMLDDARLRPLLAYAGAFRRRPNVYVQTVFSRFCDGSPDVQSFYHSDTFHPTLKAWFYLEAVGDEDAPLAYVPGSHRHNRRRLAWERRVSRTAHAAQDRLTGEGSFRFEEADIARLGYPAPRRLAVGANTLIVADTSGIHRRTPTRKAGARVAIWIYSRSNPFLPFAGWHVSGWPVLKDALMRLYWAANDRLRAALKRRSGWGGAGLRSPLSPPVAAGAPAAARAEPPPA